jgi:hypothetical protein
MCNSMKRTIQKGFHVADDNMNQGQPGGSLFRRRNFFLMFVLFYYIHSRVSIRAYIINFSIKNHDIPASRCGHGLTASRRQGKNR